MLRTAWVVTRHELHRIVSERVMIVFGLVLPILIIVLVGLTFGGAGSVDLGILDADGSPRAEEIVARLQSLDGVKVTEYDSESSMRRDVRTGFVQAGLLLPAGYGDDLASGAATVELIMDPSSEGAFSALATIDAVVTEASVHEGAVQIVADTEGEASARRAVTAMERDLVPVGVRDGVRLGHEGAGGTFSYTAPANLVLFVFINTFAVSAILANDRKTGVIRRQLSTPNRPAAILVGMGASKLAFSLVQSGLILGVGYVAFGVHWGNPLAVTALAVVFAALATSVGLLVGATASDADQAQSVGIPLAVATGMLGGCMWPLEVVPRAMQVAGHVAPHAWAMDAWQELIYDRAGLGAILPNLAVLAGATVVIGTVAAWRLRRAVLG